MEKCSACDKEFTAQDKVVAADCGCLVHVFKNACNEDDFCRNCKRQFKLFVNAPLVRIKPKEAEKSFNDALKEIEEKFTKMLEDQRKEMQAESVKGLEVQRTINLEIMKKLNGLTDSQSNLHKLFKEQIGENKKLVETLSTVLNQDIEDIKEDIKYLMDEFEGLYEDAEEACQCSHDHHHHEHQQGAKVKTKSASKAK